MESLLAPATPPESDFREATPPPEPPALSPLIDDASPPPAPIVHIPIPSLSAPAPLAAPLLPTIVGTTPPPAASELPPPLTITPTLSPVTSQPQPQPLPQSPLVSPPPINKNIPPPIIVNPPNTTPPNDKPVIVAPAPPTSSRKNDNNNEPTLPTPPSTPQLPPQSSSRHPRTRPIIRPSPSKAGTSSRPKISTPAAVSAAASPQHSHLPASAVLPSSPPVALPVPQTPSGGAWFPSASQPPSDLPAFPGPPGDLVNSPATPFLGNNNGASTSSSLAPSTDAHHQNIEAAPSSSGSSGSSVVIVGLVLGGILLLLLAAVVGILLIFCRRRQKKFGAHASGKLYASSLSKFGDKSSLLEYTKQGSNPQRLEVSVNVNTAQGHSADTSTTAMAVAGSSPGFGTHISSGTFTYEELAGATNGFSEQNLLGQGGFGYVYKGALPNGKEVAVKQLKIGGHQGEREFQAEVETISQVHHKHLVSLVGYCIAGSERLLVYEFVPNNTLDFHLQGKGQPVMDWRTRLKIAIGSAKGLAYLHEDCSPSIIHRDIKATNILLDSNFEAKVSDFGLAKIFSSTNSSVTHMTTRVVGTFGYLAPEYASSGKVTDKSDVYSYGVVLLEIITGRPPISNFDSATSGSLVNWARPLMAQTIADGKFDTLADPRLQNNYNVDEMAIMVACAAACVRLSSWRRPRMSQVIRALEGNLSASELDDGIRPGHSTMHFPYESLDFDARNYIEDMKRMALNSNNGDTSRFSQNTSEYGLNPSASSTDSSQHIY